MNAEEWGMIDYFDPYEFGIEAIPGVNDFMEFQFVSMVDRIRNILGYPLRICSGYRTVLHNEEVGGVSDSAHCKGLAADISCSFGADRFRLIEAALAVGFKRIGIGKNFVHVDLDDSKPSPAIWLY